jgi:hypothetical protein
VDHTDRQLFFSSTYVIIGNGLSTPFWEARWLLGSAPKDLAPSLFEIARFKCRTVAVELHNNNWIRNLKHINTSQQLEEFTLLFMAIAEVHLGDGKDSIFWKWTTDKKIWQLLMIANFLGLSCPSLTRKSGGPLLSIKVIFLHDWLCIIESLQ